MNRNYALLTVLILMLAAFSLAQRPGGGGPPGGRPGPVGPPGQDGPPRPDMQRPGQGPQDWMKGVDADKNGSIDNAELDAAIEATFTEFDRNHDGVLTPDELGPRNGEGKRPQARNGMDANREGPPAGDRPQGPKPGILPPFFFQDRLAEGQSVPRAQFAQMVRRVFNEMDKNSDGVLSREESKPPPREGGPGKPGRPEGAPIGPPQPPNAQFIGAELRFGDRLVKGQPFSADIVIEDDRRLYDGSIVKKQNKGAIYRDTTGRMRREQPLDNIGGFNVASDGSKPKMLIFINDFANKSQYFIDLDSKVARKEYFDEELSPRPEKNGPPDAKTESLGTRNIEGVSAEGTRITFEIPAGQVGNSQPMKVVDERWFSPELQVIVMSRHLDPLAGEHVFRMINIKRSEPSADLFTVPEGFKVESKPARRPEE